MLLDSEGTDFRNAECSEVIPIDSAAGCGSANDFLTLPDVAVDVPMVGVLKHRVFLDERRVVRAQFEHGPLRASDVTNPVSPRDALNQALSAWLMRQSEWKAYKRLSIDLYLLKCEVVEKLLESCYDDFTPTAPLYFGVCIPEECFYVFGRKMDVMKQAHPCLPHTIMQVIHAVATRTAFIRSPDFFLDEFARNYWDDDATVSDESAREALIERFGEDEYIEPYLPSIVAPQFCRDDLYKYFSPNLRKLSINDLSGLMASTDGVVREVCEDVIVLKRLLGRIGKRDLFHIDQNGYPIYSMCGLVGEDNEHVVDLMDRHLHWAYESGESTEFHGFSALSTDPATIRQQYADQRRAFRLLHHLDRILSRVTRPIWENPDE